MKTKKNLAALVVFAMVLGLIAPAIISAPASAQTTSVVGTSVVVATGGGNSPVVKAKWEQDNTTFMEDGDPSHIELGAQFLPPCTYQGKKLVEYCAIVTDEEEGGDVQQVAADVWHPLNSWELGSFKYEVPLVKSLDNVAAKARFLAAVNAGLVTLNSGYTVDDVNYELDKGTARLWCGNTTLDYEQPAGYYTVNVTAYDHNSNPSTPLQNTFKYIPVNCFAVDNNAINYGNVSISTPKVIPGNTIFALGDGKMTVRNLGNTNINITVMQDDMGFGKDVTGAWNVEFDGRVGHLVSSVWYLPLQWATLPGTLIHSTDDELDFSIHLKKGSGAHSGNMTLGSITVYPIVQ